MKTAAAIELEYNCSVDTIEANVRENSRRRVPWLGMSEPHDRAAVIVGGGPSLATTVQAISAHSQRGDDVFAVNGVSAYLHANDVAVQHHVLLDARLSNLDFVKRQTAENYIVASQCAPEIFYALRQSPVTMFHAHTDNVEAWLPEKRPAYTLIASGSTVVLAAMCIAYAMGYRKIHLYGVDSSFVDKHHAYAQPENDDDDVIEAVVAGRRFKTTPWMAAQVHQFQRVARELADGDAEIMVHGDGLLPWVAKQMMQPLAVLEAQKYEAMWSHDAYRKMSPADECFSWIERNLPDPPAKLIDFGCGTGRATKRLQALGYDVLGLDFAENCLDAGIDVPFRKVNLWDLPDLTADCGICFDVMEHIPEQHVSDVLAGISRSVQGVTLFRIDNQPDNMGALIDDTLHVTVKPDAWWHLELGKHWKYVEYVGSGTYKVAHEQ